MGETRVDLLHLLEDLRDAYPGSLEETILAEIVANSLDSGATRIAIAASPAEATLTLVDDGAGMRRRELARYHDIATSAKVRGESIGFAGVGIKLGLLASGEVLTETRLGRHHVATTWGLASRHRAPWRWVPPPGLVAARGTAVRLRLQNALSPLLDTGFIETVLRRHFQPLLETGFEEILAPHYPRGVTFEVNGAPLEKEAPRAAQVAPVVVRLGRKRRPAAAGYLAREGQPLPEERRGIAVSTLGKVIKRGWDWLGITTAAGDHVGGLIEVPALAGSLALNKADFIRVGSRGASYLTYRKAIQEAVTRQLAAWGDTRDGEEHARRRAARPVERDLQAVLTDLADDFPLLAALVEARAGGQRKLPIGHRAGPSETGPLPGLTPALGAEPLAVDPAAGDSGRTSPPGGTPPGDGSPDVGPGAEAPRRPAGRGEVRLPAGGGRRRPGHYGLSIQFEARPDDPELGRLVESTVWVNEAHPAYRRAMASRSEGYHLALAVAMALAPLAVEPPREHGFLSAFLASWGAAVDRGAGRRRRR